MSRLKSVLLTVATCWIVATAGAQQSKPPDEQGLPLEPTRTIAFTTDEGTWLSLDVSPDGRTIVFDLLGDLYTLPITGGPATRITAGLAFDTQPRFSPDGTTLAFVSDRSGSDNVWLANADGSGARVLTRLESGALVSPDWTPDGSAILVTRRPAGGFANADLIVVHTSGGSGVPVKLSGGVPEGPYAAVGAAFGGDSRYVWMSARVGQLTNLYAQDWQLAQHDLETGRTFIRSGGLGGGLRPTLSPDGRWLVFGTRRGGITELRVRDLARGDESVLVEDAQRDEAWSVWTRDVLPGSAFTPDSRALITSHHGKIWRVEVPGGRTTEIPFTAVVHQALGPLATFDHRADTGDVVARQIRDAALSPDGSRLAFTAFDRLWIVDLPSGTPRRLTAADVGEHAPAWSPDGRTVAYVTWSDEAGGDIYRVSAAAGCSVAECTPERLTRESAFYDKVAYSPDATRIVAVRGARQPRIEQQAARADLQLVWLPASGGGATSITPLGAPSRPHFATDPSRVYLYDPAEGLVSIRFDGLDRRLVLTASGGAGERQAAAEEVVLSPAGTAAVASLGGQLYLVTLPALQGPPVDVVLSSSNPAVPVHRVTRYGGEFPAWSSDGSTLHYALGRFWYRSALPEIAAAASAAARQRDADRIEITVAASRDTPSGTVALRGARVITMKGHEIIQNGDVLVQAGRILAVGPRGSVTIPDGARVIDASGKTILPGWIDIHSHTQPATGVHRGQVWEYLAQLAYGVTTTRNPQTTGTDVLSYADLVETGSILGPRIYSTARGVFGETDIRSLDDARDVVRRYSAFYDTRSLKQYLAGNRRVRQWIVMAAVEQRLLPTTEAGHDFKQNLTGILDGYAGQEHSWPVALVFKDVIELAARSGITYTPTMVINYGGPMAEDWFYFRGDLRKDEKLKRFTPLAEIERRALRRRDWYSEDQFIFQQYARALAQLVAAGGRVGLGGHGQVQGLSVHWELELMASGGMPAHDVLRAGTIASAEAIGMARDLGSLEPGKLADLQVLDRNPLDDIRGTTAIRWVMKNGRLYEAETLAEIWPRQRKLPRMWWMADAPAARDKSGRWNGTSTAEIR